MIGHLVFCQSNLVLAHKGLIVDLQPYSPSGEISIVEALMSPALDNLDPGDSAGGGG